MAILVSTIESRVRATLDAEGADYYLFDQDIKPALNNAIEWTVSVFNEIFGTKKVIPEQLRDLVKVKVWQSNKYSRVSFDPATIGHDFWTLISIMPEPKLHPNNSISPLSDPVKSVLMANKSFVSSNYSAKRLNAEEWSINTNNPFVAGNDILKNSSLKEYAYRDFADYSSSTYSNPSAPEIEIRPSVAEKYVAIEYLKYPTPVNLISDSVEFPKSMTVFLVEKTLSFLSVKQGDQTTLWQVTENDIKRLTTLFG